MFFKNRKYCVWNIWKIQTDQKFLNFTWTSKQKTEGVPFFQKCMFLIFNGGFTLPECTWWPLIPNFFWTNVPWDLDTAMSLFGSIRGQLFGVFFTMSDTNLQSDSNIHTCFSFTLSLTCQFIFHEFLRLLHFFPSFYSIKSWIFWNGFRWLFWFSALYSLK